MGAPTQIVARETPSIPHRCENRRGVKIVLDTATAVSYIDSVDRIETSGASRATPEDDMSRATIYERDDQYLTAEGWVVGAHWSDPARGQSGYWYSHTEHAPDGVQIRETPCGEDSLCGDEGEDYPFLGPDGGHSTATAALLARLAECADEPAPDDDDEVRA